MTGKILAVDDSATMRQMLEVCLSSEGFDVVTAEDGLDGIDKLKASNPDVVITDINMPRMDGFEFIEAVRGGGASSRLPILVITTESAPEKKQRARDAGATGWIVKPFDPDDLVEAVNRVMP